MIYVDNAATTFPKPEEVYLTLDKANRAFAFNAGRGESEESELALSVVEQARSLVSSFLPGTSPNRVVFASSATDSLNKIILGLDLMEGDTVYITPFEHNAIIRPLRRLEEKGVRIKVIPFEEGTWNLDETKMRQQFALDNPTAVFVSHISNATGYRLPYERIFETAKKYDAVTVLDAAQSFGVFPIESLDTISYLVFAGHKSLYGSFGVAGFVVLEDKGLVPVVCGGTGSDSLNPKMPSSLPQRYESGSLNVVAIASLVASIPWLKKMDVRKHESELSEMLRKALKDHPKAKVFYPSDIKTNGICSFAIDGYTAADIGIILKAHGISARTGYHCAPLIHDFIGSKPYEGTVRVSFGAFNTENDVNEIVNALKCL